MLACAVASILSPVCEVLGRNKWFSWTSTARVASRRDKNGKPGQEAGDGSQKMAKMASKRGHDWGSRVSEAREPLSP